MPARKPSARAGDPACGMFGARNHADRPGADWRPVEELLASAGTLASPALLLVDGSLLARLGDILSLPDHIVIVATDAAAERALGGRAALTTANVRDAAARQAVLQAGQQLAIARFQARQAEREFAELSRIGRALMRQHDRKALLRLIVAQGKRLTHSDGGGLLLMRRDGDGRQWLRAVLYAIDSIGVIAPDELSRIPVDDASIIGHVAITKQPLAVADAYDLPRDAVYRQNTLFDARYGYRRRSMLLVPMLDQLGHVLGLLVFINRKTDPSARITSKAAADRYVVAYSDHELRLARLLASQAAVAIENALLYAQIERTLESFVKASVSAIDLRDPAMAGHSLRVAWLASALASAVAQSRDGPYRDVRFTRKQIRELRFAALLHDFGKVAVREDVLLKAKKLPPVLWERVDARFDVIGCQAPGAAERAELERCREIVRLANEPTVLEAPAAAELAEIAGRTYVRRDGARAPWLTAEELHFLQLPKGTLDDGERAEVETHVTKTFRFLSNIPWTDDLKHMVSYAYGHHEALDGSGYPRRLTAKDIPLQTRLITIADMFDALTESDRPYKPAVTPERALEIMEAEAAAGRVDAQLVRVLRESGLYRSRPTPTAMLPVT